MIAVSALSSLRQRSTARPSSSARRSGFGRKRAGVALGELYAGEQMIDAEVVCFLRQDTDKPRRHRCDPEAPLTERGFQIARFAKPGDRPVHSGAKLRHAGITERADNRTDAIGRHCAAHFDDLRARSQQLMLFQNHRDAAACGPADNVEFGGQVEPRDIHHHRGRGLRRVGVDDQDGWHGSFSG